MSFNNSHYGAFDAEGKEPSIPVPLCRRTLCFPEDVWRLNEDGWRSQLERVLGLYQKEASVYGGKVLHPPLTREIYDSKIDWFSFTDARVHWGEERCRGLLKDAGLEPLKERARSQEFFRAVS